VTIRSSGLVAPLLLAGLPSCAPVRAIEITPVVGAYAPGAPLASLVNVFTPFVDYNGTSPSLDSSTFAAHQRAGPMEGGLLSVWIGPKVAVELGLGYSSSSIFSQSSNSECFAGQACTTTSTRSTDAPAFVVAGSARALVMLTPPRAGHLTPYVVAGFGFVARGGSGYDAVHGLGIESPDLGPDLGVGLRLPVTAALAARAELQVVTETEWAAGGAPNLALSVGLSVALSQGESQAR
jgi:hypothetical protein